MKRIIYLLLIVAIFSCDFSKKEKPDKTEATTVYYFIRHAEKDRSNLNDKDPKLTETGEQRARNGLKFLIILLLIIYTPLHITGPNGLPFIFQKRKIYRLKPTTPAICTAILLKKILWAIQF